LRTPIVCVVDDDQLFNQALTSILAPEGYHVVNFFTADDFLSWYAKNPRGCDLILTDVTMPGSSGFDLCLAVRKDQSGERVPIIMITGNDPHTEKTAGLNAGADDFISKPFRKNELVAKIRQLLNIRAEQVDRLGRLTKFIPPTIADMVVSDSNSGLLDQHEADVSVMFVDLRGFTAFAEATPPGDVMQVLNQYYRTVGHVCLKYKATLGHLAGDGIMVFLNDPIPVENHQHTAALMALDVRQALSAQKADWVERGYSLDFGIGLAEGRATLGGIGFDRFWGYSLIGPVANLASRLCQLAVREQILASERFVGCIGTGVVTELVGDMTIKGVKTTVRASNVVAVAQEFKRAG
jgi:adenylate cyclase